MLAIGGFSAAGLVAFLLILSLVLPGLPIDTLFGRSGSGNIFETGAAEAPGVEVTNVEVVTPDSAPPDESVAPPPAPPNPVLGGVDIFYNCPDGCDDLVAQLTAIAQEFEDAGRIVGVTPKPDMDAKLLLVGASASEVLEAFDEAQIRAFIESNATQ